MDTMQMASLKRNIFIMYVITALENALFWSPIWVLFYLRFTNYGGIGIIESTMIATAFLAELPTGAIADLLGKKGALMLAFVLGAIGNLLMGLAGSFPMLLVSVFIMTIGGAFRSGSGEALIFDSLLSIKETDRYEKILANHSTIKMLVIAQASIVGGFLYATHIGLPFIALAIALFIAAGLCLLIKEPPIDTEKFSLPVYVRQTKLGFWELFRHKGVAVSSGVVVALTMITLINGHFLMDGQLVALGWSEKALGVITASMFLFSAAIAQLTGPLAKLLGKHGANFFMATAMAVTLLFIPVLGMGLATVAVMLRNGFLEVFGNTANAIINQNVRSQYRATALSAYSMLASLPYVLTAFLIGTLADQTSIHIVAAVLGGVLLLMVGSGMVILKAKGNDGPTEFS